MAPEKTEIRKPGGKIIRGVVYSASGADKSSPLVILSHGFCSSYRAFTHHGEGFAAAGISCLTFDFCGGAPDSESDGDFADMSVLTEKSDLLDVISFAKREISFGGLFLMGESQGGLVSLLAGNEAPGVSGLVLWYPAFVIPDDAKRRTSGQRSRVLMGVTIGGAYDKDALKVDILSEQRRFTKPVLLVHGDRDGLVPISYSQDAQKRFPDAELITIEGAGHGFDYPDNERARNESIQFIRRVSGK